VVVVMMYGGFGHGAGLLMLLVGLFWVALIVLIVWLVTKVWPSGRNAQPGPSTPPPSAVSSTESPEQILDRMFALGEIDEATYRSRRTALAEMKQQP
jgi:putative membrane protein